MFAKNFSAWRLLRALFAFVIILSALLVGVLATKAADNTMVDPATLPRLEGAQVDPARQSQGTFIYSAPGSVPVATAAVRTLLVTDGWAQYVAPLEENAGTLLFKKGPQGLLVFFTMAGGKADQSSVHYVANRLNTDVPFPGGLTDVVYDSNRPYLSSIAAGNADANLVFFDKALVTAGWQRLTAADATARWPNAALDSKLENGAIAYYNRANERPIRLALQNRDGGKTKIEIKVAPFALTQDLEAGQESYGLPKPKEIKSASATNGKTRKEMKVLAPADVTAVLAFYRRELALRNWNEDERSAVINADDASVMFTSEEGKASLRLTSQYDLTVATLIVQVSEAVLAAQEKAKRDESDKFMRDAQELARTVIAADSERRAKAEALAATQPVQSLRARADNTAPIPLPDDATDIKFEADDGRLEYHSPSSVKTLTAFHRAALKELGWKETPSVINNATMVVVDFAKGKQKFSMTVMQMGPQVRVSADGDGLISSAAASAANYAPASGGSAKADQDLEADADASGFPVPKSYTLSAPGTWSMQGGQTPFRREFDASVPAGLESVLAFYRRELTKRQWKELPQGAQGASVKADKVLIAFTSPEGPAVLKLARNKGETSVTIAVKNPAEAAKAEVLPAAGQVKLVFGNMGGAEVAITINEKTVKVAPGVGGPTSPKGPTMELRPGKYKYALKVAGRPPHNAEIEVGADDTWGLMVGPGGDGALAMQLY